MEHSDEEWYCQFEMNIKDVRLMYGVVCYALETWPGYPKRPIEEQEYLKYLRTQLFSMLADYSFTRIE